MKLSNLTKNMYFQYLFLFILFVFSNLINSMFSIISVIFSIFLILKNDNTNNIKLLFFLLPNIRILDCSGFKSWINILFFIISLTIIITKTQWFNKINRVAFCSALIMFALEFVHVFENHASINNEIFNAINIAFDFFAMIIIFMEKCDLEVYKEYSYALIFGVFNSVLCFFIANSSMLTMMFTSRYRLSAYGNDPNYLSSYLVLGMCGVLLYLYDNKLNYKYLIILFLCIIIGLFTMSKMCIFCICASIFLYLSNLLMKGKLRKIGVIILRLLPFILIIYFIFGSEINYLISKFLERFSESYSVNSIANFTSGRSNIQSDYLKYLYSNLESLFFGRGINYLDFYTRYGMTFVAHNTYLDIVLSWGVFGSIIFFFTVIFCIRKYIKIKRNYLRYLLPFFVYLAMLFSLSCLSADMFWYLLAFVLIPLRIQTTTSIDLKKKGMYLHD